MTETCCRFCSKQDKCPDTHEMKCETYTLLGDCASSRTCNPCKEFGREVKNEN